MDDRVKLSWLGHTPDGLEWFATREEAEDHVLSWFTDFLYDEGEAHEAEGFVSQIVSHVREVVGATAADDSADGERCRELSVDYLVEGYKMVEGSGIVAVRGGAPCKK